MRLAKILGLGRFEVEKSSTWTHVDGSRWWHNPKTNKPEPYPGEQKSAPRKNDLAGDAPEAQNVYQGLPQDFPAAPRGKKLSYGGIVIDPMGENILMRKVAGSYGGYVWTYAKGGQDHGESPQDTANREVKEELGVNAKVHGTLPAWYEGDTSATAFFVMQQQGDSFPHDNETETTKWIPLVDAEQYISQTTSTRGKQRDLNILNDIRKLISRKG